MIRERERTKQSKANSKPKHTNEETNASIVTQRFNQQQQQFKESKEININNSREIKEERERKRARKRDGGQMQPIFLFRQP